MTCDITGGCNNVSTQGDTCNNVPPTHLLGLIQSCFHGDQILPCGSGNAAGLAEITALWNTIVCSYHQQSVIYWYDITIYCYQCLYYTLLFGWLWVFAEEVPCDGFILWVHHTDTILQQFSAFLLSPFFFPIPFILCDGVNIKSSHQKHPFIWERCRCPMLWKPKKAWKWKKSCNNSQWLVSVVDISLILCVGGMDYITYINAITAHIHNLPIPQ